MPIRWAMGADFSIGQTYILEKDGQLYESRVSWFRELNGLGPTLGYVGTTPADLQDAAGRLLGQDEKLRCFGCHATNAVQGKQLTLDHLIPGVQCGHCHQGTDDAPGGDAVGQSRAGAAKNCTADRALRGPGFQLLRPMSPHLGGDCGGGQTRVSPTFAFSLTGSRAANATTLTMRASVAWRATTRTTTLALKPVNFDPKVSGLSWRAKCRGKPARNRARRHVRSPKPIVCPATCRSSNCPARTTNSPIIASGL